MRKGRVLHDLRVKTFNLSSKPASCTIKGGKRVRGLTMGKRRVKNDLVVKTAGYECKKGRKIIICGISTRKYYDSSNPHYRISPIRMNQIVCFAELAIRFYNFKQNTNFGQVKVRKVVRAMSGVFDNRITFKAFSPLGVATVFETEIRDYFFPNHQFLRSGLLGSRALIPITMVIILNKSCHRMSLNNKLSPMIL